MAAAKQCQQEFKFAILRPAKEYYANGAQEEVLLQGVIDAWFEDEEGITVVDFKSDRIRPGDEKVRAKEYAPQLTAYRNALSEILGKEIARVVLWFFATDTMVEL